MYVGLKQPRGDGEHYVTPARAAAKETKRTLSSSKSQTRQDMNFYFFCLFYFILFYFILFYFFSYTMSIPVIWLVTRFVLFIPGLHCVYVNMSSWGNTLQ